MDLVQAVAAYQPALLSLAVLCLVVLTQALLTAPLAFVSGEQVPGSPIRGDHQQRSFRVLRTHGNSVESLAPFGLTLLIAIATGTNATLVNWLALIHLACRLLFWAIYYAGIGRVAGGPRTLSFVGGLLANVVLASATIYTLAT